MQINMTRANDFERMMTQIAKEHGCDISIRSNVGLVPPEKCSTDVVITHGLDKQQMHYIVWDKARSLTDAAVAIWASWFEYYYTKATPTYVPYSEMSSKYYIRNNAEPTVQILPDLSHSIKNVIFNDPATIVFWHDGTKTVVKCGEDDIFDPEKGLAMAISKKFLGNQGNYYNEIKKWVGKYDVEPIYPNVPTLNINWTNDFKKTLINIVDERLASIKENKALVDLVNDSNGVAFIKEDLK